MKPSLKWLDDPAVFRVNRLDARSDHDFFSSEEDYEQRRMRLYQSLNGEWIFHWSKNAAERPKKFYEMDFDESGFGRIQVPCHMEMAGFDRIHYINTMYPWEGQMYRRPSVSDKGFALRAGDFSKAEYNPVGSYICHFDLNENLRGKRVCIGFEGVEQAMYVWLNGAFVGYAEDSFTPSAFDLTPYIRETGNKLAVEVYKRSSAAYLEDQDFFRFSGIFRGVTLYAKPKIHVEDIWAHPVLNRDNRSGSFSVDLKLSFDRGALETDAQESTGTAKKRGRKPSGKAKDGAAKAQESVEQSKTAVLTDEALLSAYTVFYSLLDERGETVLSGSLEAAEELEFGPAELAQLTPWSHEHPYRYLLRVEVRDQKGALVELAPCRIGFRRIEIEDGVMLLNGKRLILNGVNRHEWNAHSGRVITLEDMLWDIECLKRNNINAVRTCHYPDQLKWYSLCDAAGIYVMAEVNLESHGSWQKMGAVEPSWNVPGDSPEWLENVLDRARTNFETFKNHPSVLFWSLGNESYAGTCLQEMNRYYKNMDPTRLTHYEGVFQNRAYESSISDVESQMYAPPARVQAYLENRPKKPFLLCEYMHDMGNSLGGMKSYIDLLDQYDMYQGGFIWDYIDQAIFVKDEATGKEVLRYGGDFDDRPSDYEFSGNGIVFADRTEKPAMQEVRYYYGLKK